ncbi:MAG: CotH kinase family protein [Lachnospiraceae bacterium]|nr:CotH kinase family protein [Lachnospiraceae bacterium]
MRKEQAFALIAIVLMAIVGTLATVYYNDRHKADIRNTYTDLAPAPKTEDPLSGIDYENDYVVGSDFSTNLPIVILDMPDGEPPISTQKTPGGDFARIEGVEPYVDRQFILIDNTDGLNHPEDAPVISSMMKIKRRGNSSMLYDKAQWTVKFINESGQYRDIDVLGMGREHEWILNGSLADKSLIRNYLAYAISSEIMPNTPDTQFCEVILKTDGQYRYHGVYLLGETIRQGLNRVNISEFNKDRLVNSYIVRRDRFDDEGVMLETYARLNGFTHTYWGIIFPSRKELTDDMIRYTEASLNEVERILYSDDDRTFYGYGDVIDTGSFVDYFLLNEFFTSYDAGNYSTYAYKDLTGKVRMGPVWDFDGTMDNYIVEPAQPSDLGFEIKPWFDRLCEDKEFVKKLSQRYAKLRTGPFSDRHITEKINEAVDHLGGAADRDWKRWDVWYTQVHSSPHIGLPDFENEDGILLHRNAETYDEELYRIRTSLHDHAEAIPQALSDLEHTATRDSGLERWKEWLLAIMLMAILFPAVYVVAKKS